MLAIQLGAQDQLRRLPRPRLTELLQRYRDCLQQAATLYQAELHTLNDGSSLMLFHSQDDEQNYLTHAICCGELMRALAHALQIDVADSGITLQLQLGLTQGDGLFDLSQGDLLLSEPAQAALDMSLHSRNLLLVESSISEDRLIQQRARIRPIASPEGACCVERLLDPYPSLLERQLARMLSCAAAPTDALAGERPLPARRADDWRRRQRISPAPSTRKRKARPGSPVGLFQSYFTTQRCQKRKTSRSVRIGSAAGMRGAGGSADLLTCGPEPAGGVLATSAGSTAPATISLRRCSRALCART